MLNIPVFIVGLIVLVLGIATLINPNMARWINLPGDAQLKAFVSIIVGIIILIISFTL